MQNITLREKMKKVSIIIPCYNQAAYICETVESALAQTYPYIEIICINDGSTDNSAEIIEKLAQKEDRLLFLNEKENKGVVQARNIAISKSTGDYILPLDADDTIEPAYVEKAVDILENNPEIGIVYCKARLFGEKQGEWKLPEFSEKEFIYINSIFVSSLFRKSDFEKAGGYKEYMKEGYEDWDLWMSFLENGLKVFRIEEFLFNYRQHKKHKSASRTQKIDKTKMDNIYKKIIECHFPLYLKDSSFIDKVFRGQLKKLKKYKKLFKISLITGIIEVFIIIALAAVVAGI